jgi:hypothetical protein
VASAQLAVLHNGPTLGVVAVLREHLAQIPPSDPEDLIFDGPGGGVAAKQPPSISALARTRSRGGLVLPVLPELPPRTRQQIGAQLATVVSSEPADRHPAADPAAMPQSHQHEAGRRSIRPSRSMCGPTSIVDPALAGTRRRASEGVTYDVIARHRVAGAVVSPVKGRPV